MIKLESVHIEELRGIRCLDVDLAGQTFAISGPNGSGKSGIIDAIEFGLTGEIGRLTGAGTKGLSLAEHGPHVDLSGKLDASFVRLVVTLPKLKRSATITRRLSAPSKPLLEPADADIAAALREFADHPEVTLSRREILRFILVEPGKRAEEIQALLKLDQIGKTRAALNGAANKLGREQGEAVAARKRCTAALQTHLQVESLDRANLLSAVNTHRQSLGLPDITELAATTRLDEGVGETEQTDPFNRDAAVRDIEGLLSSIVELTRSTRDAVASLVADLDRLTGDPTLTHALRTRSLTESGLALVDGELCPLCDTPWESKALREHLNAKLSASKEADIVRERLTRAGAELAEATGQVIDDLRAVSRTAARVGTPDEVASLRFWGQDLVRRQKDLDTFEGLERVRPLLGDDWLAPPPELAGQLEQLRRKLEAMPAPSAAANAATFLAIAQLRFGEVQEASRRQRRAERAAKAAKAAYDAYCEVLKAELDGLYRAIESEFSEFYRFINADDEVTFAAKLTPTEKTVDLSVDFFERGLFPPAAFHSEGHQDGMGLCLYLALMKRLFGDQFTLALLDDVVQSVDAGHRREFCRLLKERFPDTQFIITTHDKVWAQQMKSGGLVNRKTSLMLYGWSVDTGPLAESGQEIWSEIKASLREEKVPQAAAALRRHLEYVSRVLADDLAADVPFRLDGGYDLGDLLPRLVGRMNKLCGAAAKAAQSWGNQPGREAANLRSTELGQAYAASQIDQWAINKAVHYNEWAAFEREDFEPVAKAFERLLACFRCGSCEAWLRLVPRGQPETLRCDCSAVSLNLRSK